MAEEAALWTARTADRRRRRSVLGVGAAVSAAFGAALIALANAPAARADTEPDPFQDLFGDSGINTWTQGADNFLAAHPLVATTFDGVVDQFNATDVDPLSDLVAALDPNAFSPTGLPTDFLGDLAVTLDYGLLAPTHLASLLDPALGLPTDLGATLDPVIDGLLAGMMP